MTRVLSPREVPSIDLMPRRPDGSFEPCTCVEVQAAVPNDQPRCDMDDICPACLVWTCDLGPRPSWTQMQAAQALLAAEAVAANVPVCFYHDGQIPAVDDGEDTAADKIHALAFLVSRARRRGEACSTFEAWDGRLTHDHFRSRIAHMRRTLTARGVDWTAPIREAAPLTVEEHRRRQASWVSSAQMLDLPAVPWARYPGGDGREEQHRVRDIIVGALSAAVSDNVASMLGLICEVRVDTWMALRDMIASSARIHLVRSTAGYKQDRDSGVVLFEGKPVLAFDIGECADTFCRVGILDAELWRQNLFTAAHAVRLDPVLPLGLLPPDTRDPARPRDPADEPYISMDTLFTARPDAAEEA